MGDFTVSLQHSPEEHMKDSITLTLTEGDGTVYTGVIPHSLLLGLLKGNKFRADRQRLLNRAERRRGGTDVNTN